MFSIIHESYPDKPAMVYQDAVITYQQLLDTVGSLANGLTASHPPGFPPGTDQGRSPRNGSVKSSSHRRVDDVKSERTCQTENMLDFRPLSMISFPR
jgi:hypothetical protein